MKKIIMTLVLGLSGPMATPAALAENYSGPTTDLNRVFSSGKDMSSTQTPDKEIKPLIGPGLYVLGDQDSKIWGTHYLLVDSYVNDPTQFFALMISQDDIKKGSQGIVRVYQGRTIKNGASLMLSPVVVDIYGNLSLESETNNRAKVLEISRRTDADSFRYPFLVQGLNNALNGKLMFMRASNQLTPQIQSRPKTNVFEGTRQEHVVVNGKIVDIHPGDGSDRHFQMTDVNGDFGKLTQLQEGYFDTMGEFMVSQSKVSWLGFFMTSQSGGELFSILIPTAGPGEYRMVVYGNEERTLSDIFLPSQSWHKN